MISTIEYIKKIIFDNELYVLPLYSINQEKECTCGKKDCGSPGKHPLFKYNWKVIATNDKNKINSWFESHAKMNFGIATGRFSNVTQKYLIVIDVDSEQHEILSKLPNTFGYRTGSGGWHLWFWSKYAIKNSVSLIAEKVDIRGTDGYVVIPPSKNKKGVYQDILNYDISELPPEFIKIVFEKQKNILKKSSIKNKNINPSLLLSDWIKNSVPIIREKILNGEKVPEGVRNIVMHRLLSSDRAKGAEEEDLQSNAKKYLISFENYDTLSNEIDSIVESVLKYPTYNNSFEKVNELYVQWLNKNKKLTIHNNLLKDLDDADHEFFTSLKKCESKGAITLEAIIKEREKFLNKKGIKFISNYKIQLFAKKLESYGFKKYRTAKCNYWNVVIEGQ